MKELINQLRTFAGTAKSLDDESRDELYRIVEEMEIETEADVGQDRIDRFVCAALTGEFSAQSVEAHYTLNDPKYPGVADALREHLKIAAQIAMRAADEIAEGKGKP